MAASIEFSRETKAGNTVPFRKPLTVSGDFARLDLPDAVLGKQIVTTHQAYVEVTGDTTIVGQFVQNESDPTQKSLKITTIDAKTLNPHPIEILLTNEGHQPRTIIARVTHLK